MIPQTWKVSQTVPWKSPSPPSQWLNLVFLGINVRFTETRRFTGDLQEFLYSLCTSRSDNKGIRSLLVYLLIQWELFFFLLLIRRLPWVDWTTYDSNDPARRFNATLCTNLFEHLWPASAVPQPLTLIDLLRSHSHSPQSLHKYK